MLNVDSVSGLRGETLGVLTRSLLLGTPTLSFIGAIGEASILGVRGSSVLIALLVLPLCIPVLIFGVGAVTSSASEIGAGAHLSLLGAGLLLARALALWATATSLRIALE
jgi:heme exporter protein B